MSTYQASTQSKKNSARQRELERKRFRGEASCAECRRLKMKCDKKVPCSLCIRRGCHTICPNGMLATGQGSRLVLANTETLYKKLSQMSQRIRQLEDALQIIQSNLTEKPHPLLSDELLFVKSGVDVLSNNHNESAETLEEALTTAMGTLAICDNGATRFVGRVGTESLLMNDAVDDTEGHCQSCFGTGIDIGRERPEFLIQTSKDFPFLHAHLPREQLIKLLKEHLPSYERATALAEAYLENIAWFPRPVKREEIMENVLPFVYDKKCTEYSPVPSEENEKYNGTHPLHNLALAFALFACGAAADLTLPPNNREGKLYHILALAALSTHSIVDPAGASLETVQVITLIAQYDFLSANKSTSESATKTFSIGLVIASSIGLHRDPAHWNMDDKYVQHRRHTFWEIFTLDKWKSLGTGRPPIFRVQEIDCEFPEDEEAFVDERGNQVEGFNRWRYRFAKEIIGPLSEHMCLTRPVKYSELLEFDRKIRDFKDPHLPPYSGPTANVRDQLWSVQKEIALLSIHRNFFALAMVKHWKDPLLSPFALSFLTAYVCSIRLLRNTRFCFDQNPDSVLRLWPVWTQCLTSGVIVGSFILQTDQPSWAALAFRDLDVAVSLFRDATSHPIARRGLPMLLRLRDRARLAFQKLSSDAQLPFSLPSSMEEKDEAEELSILRGTARIVYQKNTRSGNSCCQNTNTGTGDFAQGSRIDGAPSHSSVPRMEFSGGSGPNRDFASDTIAHTRPGADATTSTSHGTTWSPNLQSSNSIEHDMTSILDTVYGSTPVDPNETVAPALSGSSSQSQGPNAQTFEQQLLQNLHGSENAHMLQSFSTSPSSSAPNSSWLSEMAQSNFTQNDPYTYSIPVPTVDAAAPTYNVSWLASGAGGTSEVNADAVQFLEDWRFLTAMERQDFPSPERA